jgi:phosphoglycerate dehydrogenase-like enzyme
MRRRSATTPHTNRRFRPKELRKRRFHPSVASVFSKAAPREGKALLPYRGRTQGTLVLAMKIAILDDYQNVALKMADWSAIAKKADIVVFNDHVDSPEAVIDRLHPFDVVCVMRERTPLTGEIIERLPNLKLIASTAIRNASIDMAAAKNRGIIVKGTGYRSTPTIEMTWALILASARHVVSENTALREGRWQQTIGEDLQGSTLGVLGLGNIGKAVAQIGAAFGMNIVAWSQNMTPEIAQAAGATLVSKRELFQRSDFLTIHLILSGRTRGLVGAVELELMKPTARLINTSRGPIVDEAALIAALRSRRIAGAAIDVFDQEPLPPQHPFRQLDNMLATPHIGYVAENLYRTFYGDTVANIAAWMVDQGGST